MKTNNKSDPSKQPSTNKTPEKEKEKEKESTKEIVKEKKVTPSRTPISLDLTHKILGDLKLDYVVVEDLKKMKVNITVFELCQITQLREQLRDALQHIQGPQDVVIGNSKAAPKEKNLKTTKIIKTSTVANTSSTKNKDKTIEEVKKLNPREDGALIGRKSRSQTPPFLLTFEIFNRNVHNSLFDSGASLNAMPYSVCKNLNAQPKMCKTNIIQLDRSHVKVMGELKDVMIQLSSNPKVHQVIDVIVVDIPEAYVGDFEQRLVNQTEPLVCNRLVSLMVIIQRSTKKDQS